MIYEHDCENCKTLGEFHGQELYYCEQSRVGGIPIPTLIARYGNKGWEYTSGMLFGKKRIDPILTEAYDRAIKKGYINENQD